MNISENGINLIKQFEGLKTQAYLCQAKVWTIGYGHTLGVKQGDVCTISEASDLLKEDILIFEKSLNNLVLVPLNQNQYDALICFIFNIGCGNFKKSTLLKLLNNADYNGAAAEFCKWIYVKGKVSEGLRRRRIAEKELFLK